MRTPEGIAEALRNAAIRHVDHSLHYDLDDALLFRDAAALIEKQAPPEECEHFSWTGDEGPVSKLGRWPERWRCDTCGVVEVRALKIGNQAACASSSRVSEGGNDD